MAYVTTELAGRDLPTAYTISTGNEAGVGVADFIEFLAEDKAVSTIILYLEEVRDPQAFLAAARHARAKGKSVTMIHPGRGSKAREAVQSHTGALAGDYDTMRVHLAHAGVVLVDTMEELVDATELVSRYPTPPTKGPGIITFSGGFCAIAHDFCEDLGLDVPALSAETVAELAPQLPAFIPPRNPLDLGTQVAFQPELTGIGAEALMKDPALGSIIIALNGGAPATQMVYGKYFVEALKTGTKPAIYSLPASALSPEFAALIQENRIIFSRSNERAMRAMARITAYGQALERSGRAVKAEPFANLPKLGEGPQPEWLGKQLLAAIGVKIPQGELVRTVEEAETLAARIGYPVALKAQSGALAHKTEAGGVILNIRDAAGLAAAWTGLHDNVAKAQPGLVLDGVLVERMAAKGLELVIGAKRDPKWGPIVLVGLGGIWVEALGDVRLLPADLAEADIVEELGKLRTAKLLKGFRGSPPVDVEAVARTVALVGRLMLTVPEITEIDINPIFAHAKGEGVTAVDALIVTATGGGR
jgi:acyl-CoA synthetase (NDP forming)